MLWAGGRPLLLPASHGDVNRHRAVICPAVHMLPALRALLLHTRAALWHRLGEEARRLHDEASFSRWGLPADWIEVRPDGAVAGLAAGFAPRFGREAAHQLLCMLWLGETEAPCVVRARAAWRHHGAPRPPAWISLPDGRFSERPGDVDLEAVAGLALARPASGLAWLRGAADPSSALTVLAAEHVRGVLAQGSGLP